MSNPTHALAREIAATLKELFAGRPIASVNNGTPGTAVFMSDEAKLAYATQIIERYAMRAAQFRETGE